MTANQAIFDRLSTELTEELVGRLIAYCDMKARRRPWYGLLGAEDLSMAGGQKPEDIVSTVIMKTIAGAVEGPGEGRRMWDGRRDLFDFLTSQIDSELSNLGKSWVNQKFRSASKLDRISEEGHRENFYDTVADEKIENPEKIALRDELEDELEKSSDEFVGGFLDVLGDDESLLAIVEQILDGVLKPKEIAAALGVQENEVYNARKRLRRRLGDYYVAREGIGPVN